MMINYFGIFLLLLTLIRIHDGAPILTKTVAVKGMAYLGSFKQPEDNQQHHYFVSYDPVDYAFASSDCGNSYIEEHGSLLSLETKEEKSRVDELLENYGLDKGEYWMSAMVDGDGKLRWGNDKELESWAPWEMEYPDSNNSQTRISLFYQNPLNSAWRTKTSDQSLQYICELM